VGDRVAVDVQAIIGAVARIRDPRSKSDRREKGVRTRIGDQVRSDDRVPKPMLFLRPIHTNVNGLWVLSDEGHWYSVVIDHFPEKSVPVFRKEMRQTLDPERFPTTIRAIVWST
jgi:hypothetical protein